MEGNVKKMMVIVDEIKTIAQLALNVQSLGNDNSGQLWDIIEKCNMLKGETIIDNRAIGNAIINTWKYPLTNLGHRGNQNRGPKTPVSIVRDADGCVLMSFTGEPYRTNAEAIAKASEFCAAMNEWHERVGNADRLGNAAAMREALYMMRRISDEMNGETFGKGDEEIVKGWANTLRYYSDRALSSPQRNCDRFGGDEVKIFDCYIQERKFCEYKHLFPDYGFWLLKTAKTKGAVE